MRIKTRDPKTYSSHDAACPIIEAFGDCSDKAIFFDLLRENTPLKLNTSTSLSDWVDVLNALDDALKGFIDKYKETLFLPDGSARLDSPVPVEEQDVAEIKIVFLFTASLLQQSYSKDIYASVEHLIEFLNCYDISLVFLSLDCLHHLSLPPSSHRCEQYLERHITALHRNVAYFASLFDIVENAYTSSPITEYLSSTHVLSHDSFVATMDSSIRLFSRKDAASYSSVKEDVSFQSIDVRNDSRDLREIFKDVGESLSAEQRSSLLWQLHSKRLLMSDDGKLLLVSMLYEATSILLSCYPDSNVLLRFFLNKAEMIKDFIYLLENGPGEKNFDPRFANMEIRNLACFCLSAMIETRDSLTTPIFVHYPWILHDLGVGRGQFMGLLPQLLRSSVTFLIQTKAQQESLSLEQQQRLDWIENIFMVLAVMVNITSAVPSLLHNGLVSSLLSLVSCEHAAGLQRSKAVVHIEALGLEILETAVGQNPQGCSAFRDHDGLDILVRRLLHEVNQTLTTPLLLPEDNIVIQVLISLITTYVHDGQPDGGESTQSQLYRHAEFLACFHTMFSHAEHFSTTITSSAITLLVGIINRDPAPPTILNAMLSSQIPQEALRVLARVSTPFLVDLPLNNLNLISALSITTDGAKVVLDSNIFSVLLRLYNNDKCFLPVSKTLCASDVTSNIGAGLEEILRHHPQFLEPCVDELVHTIRAICDEGDRLLATNKLDFSEEFSKVLQFGEAFCSTLEPLLMKKQVVERLIDQGGFDLLLRLWNISLGPPRFLVCSLACATEWTAHSIGCSSLEVIISRCMHQIAEVSSSLLLTAVLPKMSAAADKFEQSVAHHRQVSGNEEKEGEPLLWCLLDSMSMDPLPATFRNKSEVDILSLAQMLSAVSMLNRLCSVFGMAISVKSDNENQEKCVQSLKDVEFITFLRRLIDTVFVGAQREMARARNVVTLTNTEGSSLVQPLYHLLIVGDSVSVKDSLEDGAKKVARLSKGSRVIAHERAYTSGSALKYRVAEGWINVFKGVSNEEPQFVVFDLSGKNDHECEEEFKRNMFTLADDGQKRFEFDKLSNVSARRAGFLSLFHLYFFVKGSVLGSLMKINFVKEPSLGLTMEQTWKFRAGFNSLYPIFLGCIQGLLSPSSCSSPTAAAVAEGAFVPSFEAFGADAVYLTTRAVEICRTFLFEYKSRSTRPSMSNEISHYFLALLVYNEHDLLSRLLESTVHLFECALDPAQDSSNSNKSNSGSSQQGPTQERRVLAVSSLDVVLEFWKSVLAAVSVSSSNSAMERLLSQGLGDDELRIGCFKLVVVTLIGAHLHKLWTNKFLCTLPPTHVKLVIELMNCTLRALRSMKDLVVITRRASRYPSSRSNFFDRLGINFGEVGAPLPRARAIQSSFVPDQAVVQTVMEMGFERRSVIGAMRVLRSNDANALVPFLLDNPYLVGADIPEAEEDIAVPNANPSDTVPVASDNVPPAEQSISDQPTAANPSLLEVSWEMVPRYSPADKADLKAKCEEQLQSLLSSSMDIVMDLVERGKQREYGLLDPDIARSNASFSAESFTVTVLNLSFRVFTDLGVAESVVRLIEISKLIEKLNAQLQQPSLQPVQLYNLLLGVLLLCTGKIGNFGRSASGPDVVLQVMRTNPHMQSCFESLIDVMRVYLTENEHTQSLEVDWCVASLLLLDALFQVTVVDAADMRGGLRELETLRRNAELRVFVGDAEKILPSDMKDKMLREKSATALPLQGCAFSTNQVTPLVLCCSLLLRRMSEKEADDDKSAAVQRAVLQLLIHQQNQHDIRGALHEQKLEERALRIHPFEGDTNMIVTFLQRQLEDDFYLRNSFKSSMKVVFDRVAKGNTQIPLKSFVELCCPLLYRKQDLFFEVLTQKYQIINKDEQLFLAPLQAVSVPESTLSAPSAVSERARETEVTVSAKKARTGTHSAATTKVDRVEGGDLRKHSDAEDHACKAARVFRHQVAQAIMESLFAQVTTLLEENCKYAKRLSVSQLLGVAADLVVSSPAFLTQVLRHRVGSVSVCEFVLRELVCGSGALAVEALDASKYFFAAVFSRSGESRSIAGAALLSFMQQDCLKERNLSRSIRVAELLLSLLSPPSKWTERDSFIIPTAEVARWMRSSGLFDLLMVLFGELDPASPADRAALRVLTQSVDILVKRGELLKKDAASSEALKFSGENIPHTAVERRDNDAVSAERRDGESQCADISDAHLVVPAEEQLMHMRMRMGPEEEEEGWGEHEDELGAETHADNESELEPNPENDDDDDDDEDDIELEEMEEEEQDMINQRTRGSAFSSDDESSDGLHDADSDSDSNDDHENGNDHESTHDHDQSMDAGHMDESHIHDRDEEDSAEGSEDEHDEDMDDEGESDIDDEMEVDFLDEDNDHEDEDEDNDEDAMDEEENNNSDGADSEPDNEEEHVEGVALHNDDDHDDEDLPEAEEDVFRVAEVRPEDVLDANDGADYQQAMIPEDETIAPSLQLEEGDNADVFDMDRPSRPHRGRERESNIRGRLLPADHALRDHLGALHPMLRQLLGGPQGARAAHGGNRRTPAALRQQTMSGEQMSLGDLQELVQGVMQSGGEVSSSRASVDQRTGAITVSISRRNSPLSAAPSFHPLLQLGNDARRGRGAFSSSVMRGLATRHPAVSFLSLSPPRDEPHLVFEAMRGGGARLNNLSRRREVGPLVSDRRWGLDLGDLDPAGATSITPAVSSYLRRTAAVTAAPSSVSPDSIGPMGAGLGDDRLVSNFFRAMLSQSARNVFSQEESKEEGELQETKEDDDERWSLSLPPQPRQPQLHGEQQGSSVSPVSAPVVTTTPGAMSALAEQSSSSSSSSSSSLFTTAAAVPSTAPHEINQENVDFVESLPAELRREVLLAAEDEFLAGLTVALQTEARILKAMAAVPSIATDSVSVSLPASVPAATEPNTVAASISTGTSLAVPVPAISKAQPAQAPEGEQQTVRIDPAWLIFADTGTESACPVSSLAMARALHWLYASRNDHLSTVLLKFLATLCRFNSVRPHLVAAFVGLLRCDAELVVSSVMRAAETLRDDSEKLLLAVQSLRNAILCTSDSLRSAVSRKLLATFSVLLRKTEHAVWLELLTVHDNSSSINGEQRWLFAAIISELEKNISRPTVDLDSTLQLVEKLCAPLAKLSAAQANALVSAQLAKSVPSDHRGAEKKSANDASIRLTEVLLPFPLLTQPLAHTLASIVRCADCSGLGRKTLTRILRHLSLCDANWRLLLQELSASSLDLISKTVVEFRSIQRALQSAVSLNEDALSVLMRPEFSGSQVLWEVRLYNALNLMTMLRARSTNTAKEEALVVSEVLAGIDTNELWDALSDCLDIVRAIEGIQDSVHSEAQREMDTESPGNGPLGPSEDQKVLSALVTRFIPLMECCLIVCDKTALICPSAQTQTPAQDGEQATELVRSNSVIPGSRFRQSQSYLSMQMEVKDKNTAARLARFTEHNRQLLNVILKNNVHLLESSFATLITVPKCRSLLHFDVKRAYFKSKLKKMRQSASRQSFQGSLRIAIRRSHVFEESFQALRGKTTDEMRRKLSVAFHGEEGMDAGGLTREWYSVLAREIFNANYALFTSAGDNVTFQPNPHSFVNPDHLSYFKFIGRVIGKAICDGHLLDAHFTRSFYKHILGLPVTVHDLEAIEPEYYKSLVQILDTPLDLLGLDLTFSAETNEFGKISTSDLIPNGGEVAVTDENKHEYVRLLAHHRMTSAIRKQTDAFLEGFHELVPAELVSIFDAQELELLISGLPEIDLDDLRGNTDYHGYKSTDPIINNFWNVLKGFSKEEKALFLQFVTGTSKVPLEGFKALQGADGIKKFNIHKAFGEHKLPSAHTCFNQLDLPEYTTEEILRERLLLAIKEGSEGFGFA